MASLKISIAAATEHGVYKERKPAIAAAKVKRLSKADILDSAPIAGRLGLGRASAYQRFARPRQPPVTVA
jgi:hypothetical protein